MPELHFSVAAPEQLPDSELFFNTLFSETASAPEKEITTESVPWGSLWQYIQTKTISRTGLDVSEVGSSWIGSLADASALRPFTEDEVVGLGGRGQFSPSAWERAGLVNDNRIYSIPWLTDTRVIYYWNDMLRSAGLDGATAFKNSEQLSWSLAKLHETRGPSWGVPTFACNNTVHHIASWLWDREVDFVSADASRTAFSASEAISAISAYFELFKFMPGSFDSFGALSKAFMSRQLAVVMDGPWLLSGLMKDKTVSDKLSGLRIALPPGAPFLGGSNLVVWKYIDDEKVTSAMALIRELLTPRTQSTVCNKTGLLPVRMEMLLNPPFTTDINYSTLIEAEQRGRHLPRIAMWGPIENSLVQAFGRVWQVLMTGKCRSVEEVLKRALDPLAKRFDTLMSIF